MAANRNKTSTKQKQMNRIERVLFPFLWIIAHRLFFQCSKICHFSMKSMTVDVCVDGDGIVGVFFFDPWPNVTRTIGPIQRRVVIAARHDIDGVLLFIRDG